MPLQQAAQLYDIIEELLNFRILALYQRRCILGPCRNFSLSRQPVAIFLIG